MVIVWFFYINFLLITKRRFNHESLFCYHENLFGQNWLKERKQKCFLKELFLQQRIL
jgi:hypothetical protein